MQQYKESYLARFYGNNLQPVSGAEVIVTKADGSPAAIFSDNGVTPITSLLTGADGEFAFYAANGTYTLTLRKRGLKDEVVAGVQLYDPMDDGAATLGFQPAGVAAVPRTTQDKLRESVSVMDFGAIPSPTFAGAVDLSATLAAAGASQARTIHIPDGYYGIGSTVPFNMSGRKVVCSSGAHFVLLADLIAFDLNPNANPASVEANSASYGEWYGGHFTSKGITDPVAAGAFVFNGFREMKFWNVRGGEPDRVALAEIFRFSGLGGHVFSSTRSLNVKRAFYSPQWSMDPISGPVTTTRLRDTNFILSPGQTALKVEGGWNRWVIEGGFCNLPANSKGLHFTNNIDGQGLWITNVGMEQLSTNAAAIFIEDVGGVTVSTVNIDGVLIKGDPVDGGAYAVRLQKTTNVLIDGGRLEQTTARGNYKLHADANCRDIVIGAAQRMAPTKGVSIAFARRNFLNGRPIDNLILALAAYNGAARSSESTTIDMGVALGGDFPVELPPKGYSLLVHVRDSGSAAMANRGVEIMQSTGVTATQRSRIDLTGLPNDTRIAANLYVPADANGNIAIQTFASGTDTLDLWITVLAIHN